MAIGAKIGLGRSGSVAVSGTLTVAGTLTTDGAIYDTGNIDAGTITGTLHDWAPTGFASASIITFESNNAFITGIAGGTEGRIITLINHYDSSSLTLKHANTGSVAANRILLASATDQLIRSTTGQSAVRLIYSTVDGVSRWRVLSIHSNATNSPFINGGVVTNETGFRTASTGMFKITASGDPEDSIDVAVGRTSAGVLQVNSGVLNTLRDLSVRSLQTATGGSCGFFGTAQITKPTVAGTVITATCGTGVRSLLTALSALGLINDTTTDV